MLPASSLLLLLLYRSIVKLITDTGIFLGKHIGARMGL